MFLLDAVVQAMPTLVKAKQSIKVDAYITVPGHHRCMVDAQKQFVCLSMPPRVPLAFRKMNNLQRMAVGILEIKGLDIGCFFVPARQSLWSLGDDLNTILPQRLVR